MAKKRKAKAAKAAKVKDEVRGKERREEDQAPEEEVGVRCFTVFDFE